MLNKSITRTVFFGQTFWLCILYFFAYGSGAAWRPLFCVYLKDASLSGIQIGVIAGIIPAVMLVTQPFWGMGADRWGRRRCLMLAMLFSSALLSGFLFNAGFWFFFCWTIVVALFANPVPPIIDSLALDHLETKRKLSYGHFRIWGAIGWGVIAAVMSLVVSRWGMKVIFPAAGVLMFAGWLIGFRLTRPAGGHSAFEVNWKNLALVLHNRRLIIFLVAVVLLSVAIASTWTFYAVYLDDMGASRKMISLAFGIQGFSELPFYLIAGAIIKRFGCAKTLLFTFFATSVRLFLYSITSTPAVAMSIEVMHGLSWTLFLVASVEYVNKLVEPKWRATGQSLFWAAYFGAGLIIGSVWAGFLYDRMPLNRVFGLNGCLVFLVFLAGVSVFGVSAKRGKPSIGCG
ncbi:MAG: MFS transporter [Planctomycetota bacterium]|jgi:PPP family 3-phenylpropionic acid transporter